VADAYACLDSLRHMLQVRRQELMEKMARGMEKDDSYRELVGRCKELAETIDKIKAQIKDINGGDDDETLTGK
jgi:sulfur transfer protein SufE